MKKALGIAVLFGSLCSLSSCDMFDLPTKPDDGKITVNMSNYRQYFQIKLNMGEITRVNGLPFLIGNRYNDTEIKYSFKLIPYDGVEIYDVAVSATVVFDYTYYAWDLFAWCEETGTKEAYCDYMLFGEGNMSYDFKFSEINLISATYSYSITEVFGEVIK